MGSMLRGVSALGDPLFFVLLALGLVSWLLPEPDLAIPWTTLAALAVIEEIVFRGLLQDLFGRIFPGSFPVGLTPANLSTSLVFSLVHLLNHPPLWAISVFLPSLVFGWAKDRYGSLLPCIMLHFTYNLLFFHRP